MAAWLRAMVFVAAWAAGAVAAAEVEAGVVPPAPLAVEFMQEVQRRLALPEDEQQAYAGLLSQTLALHGADRRRAQFAVMVDRSPQVQAALLFWVPAADTSAGEAGTGVAAGTSLPRFVGAVPVSTGRSGGFEHFDTPLGVFEHTLANPDFRAEGTLNEFGIRGYGAKGRRVFDFGWQPATRTWGAGGRSSMRLQLHATDPQQLEPRLGSVQSKGCIRTTGDFNRFLDLHGVLDADYDVALSRGETLWMLLPERQPTPWPGRYLVVVETPRSRRPAWSPWPAAVKQTAVPTGEASRDDGSRASPTP